MKLRKLTAVLLVLLSVVLLFAGCVNVQGPDTPSGTSDESAVPATTSTAAPTTTEPTETKATSPPPEGTILESGSYSSKDDVALYIHTFGHLPPNFLTKAQAKELGWSGGSLDKIAPGKCIGGDRFGNYEGLLPEKEGRFYTECDIDTLGKSKRGAKRIIFSNDGLIYYTADHYESFTLLFGEEDK